MATQESIQFANRFGLNVKVYEYVDGTAGETEVLEIDFANSCALDISGERVWATGGQEHANKIAFNDPIQGTFTISTQIMTNALLALMSGKAPTGNDTEIVFENTATSPAYFTITAETVWQNAKGTTQNETITLHKVCPKRAYNMTYTGEGDPASIDVEFDVLQDALKKVVTINKAVAAAE